LLSFDITQIYYSLHNLEFPQHVYEHNYLFFNPIISGKMAIWIAGRCVSNACYITFTMGGNLVIPIIGNNLTMQRIQSILNPYTNFIPNRK
jgi:hypothetical protein